MLWVCCPLQHAEGRSSTRAGSAHVNTNGKERNHFISGETSRPPSELLMCLSAVTSTSSDEQRKRIFSHEPDGKQTSGSSTPEILFVFHFYSPTVYLELKGAFTPDTKHSRHQRTTLNTTRTGSSVLSHLKSALTLELNTGVMEC